MRRSHWTPSIVPGDNEQTVYLVAEDFGKLGRAWREAEYEATDLETVIQDLLSDQYNDPIRVIAFNTEERWSEDVSEDVAQELRRRCDLRGQMGRGMKPKVREHTCPACRGTGFPAVKQPVQPGRRIYPIKCVLCGGKGRIADDDPRPGRS